MYQHIDVFTSDATLRPREDLQIPSLQLSNLARPEVAGTFDDFYHRLNTWSGHLIDDLASIPGIVIAGRAVLSAVVRGGAGDIDIFLMLPVSEAGGGLATSLRGSPKNRREQVVRSFLSLGPRGRSQCTERAEQTCALPQCR